MRGSRKNGERGEQVRKGKNEPAKLEPLRPQAIQPDILRDEIAKFPEENPYPVLRIHKNGTVLFANKASEGLLKAKSSGMGQPAPAEWHRLVKKALSSGQVIREETEHDGRVFALRAVPIVDSDYVNFYGADITERKQAEEQLRETTQTLEAVIQASPLPIFAVDRERIVKTWNPAAERTFGWSAKEAIGRRYPAIPKEKMDEADALLSRALESGLVEVETLRQRKDGSLMNVNISAAPLRDSRGNINGVMAVITDITERKKAEERVKAERQRLYDVLETLPVMVCLLTPDYHIAFTNRVFREKFGEDNGRYCYDYIFGRKGPCEFCEAYNVLKTGKPHHWECTGPDGCSIIDVHDFPFTDTDGTPLILEMDIDITERKRAEEALRSSENKYRTLLENLPQKIFLKDRNSVYISCNENYSGDLKIRARDIAGKTDYDFHPEELADKYRADDKRIMEEDKTEEFEEEYLREGEKRWVHTVKTPVKDALGNLIGILGIFWDITERKRAEEEVKKSNQLLRDTGEMAKVGGWELDLSTREVICTEETCRIHGVEPGHKLSLEEALNFYAPESRPDLEAVLKKAAETGEPYDLESLFIPSGSKDKIWVRSLGRAVYSGGKIVKLAGTFQNIDKYKRAEEALKESEKRYRRFYEDAPLGYQSLDAEGCFIDVNSAWLELLGYRREEVIGRWFGDFHTRESLELFRERFPRFKASGTVRNAECELVCKDGSRIIVSINGKISYDEHGYFKQTHCILHNVTEQKRAEEALRKSENHYRMLAETMNDGLGEIDESGRYVYANRKLGEILGFSSDKMIGRHWSEFYDRDAHEIIEAQLIARREGLSEPYEFATTRKDGRKIHIRVSPQAISDAHGKFKGSLAVFTDITRRKHAEEELLKERNFAKSLVETAQAIILVLDTQGRIVDFNPYMEEVSGYRLEEVQGRDWFGTFLPERERQRVRALFSKAISGIQTRGNVDLIVTKSGNERQIEWYDKALKDSAGNIVGLLSIGQDITERKQAEEALQEERNLLRTLIDHIPDKVYVKDRDGRFVLCNKAVLDYEGVKNESDIIGRTDFDLYERSRAQQFFDDEQKLMRTGRSVINREKQCPDKAGNPSCVLGTKVLLRDSHGDTIGIVAIDRNITERKKTEEEMVRLNRVMETITDLNQCIFRIQDRDEMLRKVCETIVSYAYRMVWIGFCDEKSKLIVPQAQAGFEEGYLASVKITYNDSEHGRGPSGIAVKTSRPNIMRFISTDPLYEPWRAEAMKRGYRSSAAIPIFGENKVIGVLNVYADKEDAFDQQEVKLLEELAHDISTGLRGIDEQTRRRQAEHKLLEYQKQLKRLAAQLSLAEERERRRIAGELHDHVSQSLAFAKIKLDSLHSALSSQPMAGVIEDISGSIEQAIQDTRTLTFDLSNPILYELGFEAAVSEWLNENVRDKHKINTEFQDDGRDKPLDDDMRALLFRNVRELLINTIKYSGADKVRVSVRRIDDSIEVVVEDNGVGFDPVEVRTLASKRAEFGLLSICESLEQLGGHFEIESKPGAGCTATMTAPLKGQQCKKEE